jgi:hypothetical protein
MKTAQTDAWIADVGVGVGAAAIVIGFVLIATGHAPDSGAPAAEHRSGLGWDITAGPGTAGGVLRGSF